MTKYTYHVDGEEVEHEYMMVEAGILLKSTGHSVMEFALLAGDGVYVPPSNLVRPAEGPFEVVKRD
jgi:hypothetical protein